MLTEDIRRKYVNILKEELIPAMGCTEPISIAYAAALAKKALGDEPVSATIAVSGNIVKNAKSVTVPHTGGMRGIKAAFSAGIVAGDAETELEVLSGISEDKFSSIRQFCEAFPVTLEVPEDARIFDIRITLRSDAHESYVRITDRHTNVVCIRRDHETLLDKPVEDVAHKEDRSVLNVEDIIAFAAYVPLEHVEATLTRQIQYNMAIAEEGLTNSYGANIGKVILTSGSRDLRCKLKAYAAAGSDARMNGCELPVIINSGSGNQGMTCSVPVIVYARETGISEEKLYRALLVSNLITIHLKSGIGTLSAYCGVVSAAAGAACGIAYLMGGGYSEIAHTLVNALAIDSGIICDGAKASCAAKIATAVESGLLGLDMYYNGNQFYAGDGIVKKGVENTIRSVSRLAHTGMKETDQEIIRIMLDGAIL